MDDSAKRDRELMDLLSTAWDDRLDESSCQRLEQLLAEGNVAATRLLTDFTRLHIDLELLMSSSAAQRKAAAAVARARHSPDRAATWSLTAKPVMGLAACLLLALTVIWQLAPWSDRSREAGASGDQAGAAIVRPPLPVGRLVAHATAQWGNAHQLLEGQTLMAGQVIDLAAGSARISMDVGAEIVLQAPCRATLIAADMVTLDRGALAVKVADWAAGFKVRTDNLLVTDFGTRFLVHADAGRGSEVHVIEGLVEAKALKHSTSPRRLAAGQAASVDAEGALNNVAFRRERWADELERLRPLRLLKLANTGVGQAEGADDPHWRITTGDALFGPYPQFATVSPAAATYGANDPGQSQWISVKNGTTTGVPARSKYSFQTTFDLTGFDPRSVRLTGLVLADNGIEEIRLNGRRLPISPWHDWFAEVTFFAFHTIEIADGFLPGKNVLSLVVINDPDLPAPELDVDPPDTPNPLALRIEWHGSGRPR